MKQIIVYFLFVVAILLATFIHAHSQYDVTSFNSNNTWRILYDSDIDTIWAYNGDCLDVPLYIYFNELPTMYTFTAFISIDSNLTISGISLENTIFGDRFIQPEIFSYDSIGQRYFTSVSDTIFSPPYHPDSIVHVAYHIKILLNEDSAPQALILLADQILLDSTGYFINVDHATLNIIIDNLPFERGDIDHDTILNQDDLILLLQYIYQNGPPPNPLSLGDLNRDCTIDILDVLCLRNIINEGILKGGNP
jgi:hypothetical protein